jgi:hypothetical protein
MKIPIKINKEGLNPSFDFDYKKTHFNIRFAWNPLLILEYYYNNLGGTDFMITYNHVKNKVHWVVLKVNVDILAKAILEVKEFFHVLEMIDESGLPVMNVYTKPILTDNNNNYGRKK